MECEWFKTLGIIIGITLFSNAEAQRAVLTGNGLPPVGGTVPAGSQLMLTCSCSQSASAVTFWLLDLINDTFLRQMRMVLDNTGTCWKTPSNPSGLSCNCVNQQVYTCTIERIEVVNKKAVWNCECTMATFFTSNNLTINIAVGITGVSLSPSSTVKIISQSLGNIVCTTTEGIPAALVHWFKETSNGVSNITSLSSPTLTLNANGAYVVTSTLGLNPSREDNTMRVFCNASNLGTWYKSSVATVEVLYRPDAPSCSYGSSPVTGTFRVTKGSTLNIQCSSTSNPLPDVYTWTLPNSSSLVGAQLSVPDIQPSLSGSYKIQARNSMTPTGGDTVQGTNTSTVTVDVQYPPSKPQLQISSTPVTGSVKIIEGESYTLRCESDSNPAATYIWTHPRGHPYPNQSTLSLTKPAATNDTGEYVCRAENTLTPTGGQAQLQTSSSSLKVDILYSARIPYFKYGSTTGDSIQGNSINIVRYNSLPIACIADSNPAPAYMWEGQTGSSQLLNVNNIQYSGSKQCSVTTTLNDTLGRTVTATNNSRLQIIVLYPPEIPQVAFYYNAGSTIVNISAASVLEGDSFYLQCAAQSNPNSSYSWNNQPATQGIFHMTNISRSPSQIQARCSANNSMATSFNGIVPGSSSTTVNISVLYGPKMSAMSSQDVIRGQTFQQTCLFTPGNPIQTTFRWTRSSGTNTWTVQTGQTVVINSVQRSDDSDYTCEVSNLLNRTVGTSLIKQDSGSFHLNVLFGAEKLALIVIGFVGRKNVTVNEGEAHTFKCSLESNPGSMITIQKDGTEVFRALNSRILEYTNNSYCEAAGLYTCSGGNDHGAAGADSVHFYVKCSARRSPFVEINNNVSSQQAVNTTISFYTQAYPDPQYKWQRCKDACITITDGTDYKIASNGLISNLTILNVEESDYGSYKVIANNSIGAAWIETFQLIPYDKPSMPQSFHVVENTITPTEVILAWTPGFNGGSQQTFQIQYKTTSAITWLSTTVGDTGATDMNVTIRDLSAGTQYQAYLFSKNQIGSSPNTTHSSFTTAQDEDFSISSSKASISSSKAGVIVGSIVGALLGLLAIVMTVIALRKYELICKCVRKPGEYESLGNRNDIRRNQPDFNSSGDDNELGTNAYDSLDAHQSSKHVYSELGRQLGTGKTRLYENTAVQLDAGTAVYVNTTFENA